MPNWCNNHVIIEGSIDEVTALLDLASKGTDDDGVQNIFSFENVYPTPKTDNVNSFLGWHVDNWGTKWDLLQSTYGVKVSTPEPGGVEGCLVFEMHYETAWSPAVGFWLKVSELYPTLQITQQYFEEGMGFIGEVYVNSEELNESHSSLTNSHYIEAGAIFDSEGDIDWDATEEFDMWKVFPIETV